ncbi:MAG: ABC transporter permease subunit [Chloroflexi bacterium]|nr:ABC transporter permease subunit [Chloroflexota bacterium]
MAEPATVFPAGRAGQLALGKRLRQAFGKDWKIALVFLAPTVILIMGLILYPFLNALVLSFFTRSINRQEVFVGFSNYIRLLDDEMYTGSLLNTIRFTLFSVVTKLVTSLLIASVLNSRIPGRNVLAGIMLLPWIVPEVVTALTWRGIYDPIFGGLNPVLRALGVVNRDVAWLAEPNLALASVIAVNVWKGIPFFTILLLAGMKAIDKELYEAAEVDGANALERFLNITLPGLRYVIAVTMLLSTISTFNSFGIVYLLTGGGPGGETRVYSILAYERALLQFRYGPGAAVSLSTVPFLAVFILLLARFMRQGIDQSAPETRLSRLLGKLGRLVGAVLATLAWPLGYLSYQVDRLSAGLAKRTASVVSSGGRHTVLTSQQREGAGVVVRLLVLLPFLLFVLFPFYWVVATAFKSDLQISQRVSLFWPDPWTIQQFDTLINKTLYATWFKNTVVIAAATTVLSVFFAALGGYALARLKFRGAGALTTVLLITYLLPGSLMFIPMYRILTGLGVINTHLALIITYPTFLIPFASWVMMGYYRSIPEDLEESAQIDGATRFTAFVRITLPLALPGLLAVTLIAFTNAWNEFLYAFIFLTSERLITLPVGLQKLVFADIYPYGQLMAASLIMSIPVVALYIFAQRFLVEGLTAGSVKG